MKSIEKLIQKKCKEREINMKIFVQDCFQWIAFHIIEQLIDNGYTVYGKHEAVTSQAEFLSSFLGRNSLFHYVNDDQGTYDMKLTLTQDKLIMTQQQDQGRITMRLPILFGEWMTMDKSAIIIDGKRLAFSSSIFLKEAIYIHDFVQGINQWLNSSYLPEDFVVFSTRSDQKEDIKLDKTIYIRDNIPIEYRLEQLLVHYQKYKDIYYQQ